jgi:hypothetical protein
MAEPRVSKLIAGVHQKKAQQGIRLTEPTMTQPLGSCLQTQQVGAWD